jgi:hypothetical protein
MQIERKKVISNKVMFLIFQQKTFFVEKKKKSENEAQF